MSEPAPSGVGVPTCYRHPGRETWIRCQRCERPICPDCMRDAAVGFQCPDCVAEGARTTRAGQATYGGRRSHDPRQTTIALIAINLAVWVGGPAHRRPRLLAGRPADAAPAGPLRDRRRLLPRGRPSPACATIPDTTWVDGLADGSWWMAVTHGFVHVDVWHIALNCLGLWVLGPPVEAALGRVRFLARLPALHPGRRRHDLLARRPRRQHAGRLGRGVRADGRPGRARAQGRGRPARPALAARRSTWSSP